MNFFDSEIVREEIKEINRLQDIIYKNVYKFPTMGTDEQLEHINILEDLLERQRILYTRMKLSDDPEAIDMKNMIEESAVLMGMQKGVDMNVIFNNMSSVIKKMKDELE